MYGELSFTTGSTFPRIVRAMVFDMDGTLYSQPSLRARMAGTMVRAICSNPRKQMRVIRFLTAYREAQEHLRRSTTPEGNLATRQLEVACARSKTSQTEALEYLQQWFDRASLKHLTRLVNEDVTRFLKQAKASGLALGVYSDYPATQKLT